jgi:hypothetical protein
MFKWSSCSNVLIWSMILVCSQFKSILHWRKRLFYRTKEGFDFVSKIVRYTEPFCFSIFLKMHSIVSACMSIVTHVCFIVSCYHLYSCSSWSCRHFSQPRTKRIWWTFKTNNLLTFDKEVWKFIFLIKNLCR